MSQDSAMQDASANTSAPPLDEDLYCPGCGYDLRGLPGDPIRCPECFQESQRAELRQRQQKRTLTELERACRKLEALGNLCAVGVTAGLPALAVVVVADEILRSLLRPAAITAGVVWLVGFGLFAARCRRTRGWLEALGVYHLYAVPAMAGNLVLIVVTLGLGTACLAWGDPPGLIAAPLLLLGTPLLVVLINPMRWLSRRGRPRLEPVAQQIIDRRS